MTETVRRPRLAALDALRGLAVAGMILATNPGDWAHAYHQLQHADWNGWTLTDMVFPTFLFSVGMALGLSFPRAMEGAAGRLFWLRVARRTAALILLGLALEATYNWCIALGAEFPGKAGLANMRLPGILQRIGLCYALAAGLIAVTGRREGNGRIAVRGSAIAAAIGAVLIGYWALMLLVPVPGVGAGHLDPAGNLEGYVDRLVFTVPHLWPLGWARPDGPAVYDPEGLLSTFPATTDTLFGVLAGAAWVRRGDRALGPIAIAALLLFVAGLALDPLIPINKRIFTPNFALLSSGFAGLVLVGLAMLWRYRTVVRFAAPLRILGGNAILAFVISTLFGRFYGFRMTADGDTPQSMANAVVLGVIPNAELASLVCAVVVLALITIALAPLHARAIHFRL